MVGGVRSHKNEFCGLRRVPSDAEIILSLLVSASSPNEHHCPASLWWVSLGPHYGHHQRHGDSDGHFSK